MTTGNVGRHGSPYEGIVDRLLHNSVHDDRGCWVWLGCCSRDGYPRITVWQRGHRVLNAHRVAYEVFKGPIPEGHDLDHRKSCPRRCINPGHMTPRPWREHRRDTVFKGGPKPLGRQLSLQALY